MAERVSYVPRPYVREPIVSDTRTLGALLLRQGQDAGTAAAIRGATAAQMWENLARGFQQYQNATRQEAEQAATFTLREQEREANERLKREEMAARAEERKEAARIRQEGIDRQEKADAYKRGGDVAEEVGYGPLAESQVDDVMAGPAAGRARYVFGPGTSDGPELQPNREQQRGIEVEKAIQGMGGTIGPNGQVVMPPKPAEPSRAIPAMVNGRRTFVRETPEGFTDLAGRPVNAEPISPQTSTQPSGPRPLTQTAETQLINRLVNQWTAATKPQKELKRQIEIMDAGLNAARKGNLAQGNEAVLQTFLKVLDPNSVVREGEFWRLQEGQSVLNRARAAVQRLTSGGWVPNEELERYATLAKEVVSNLDTHLSGTRARIQKNAERYNIPPELVFDDTGAEAPTPAPAGAVEKWERGPDGKPRKVGG